MRKMNTKCLSLLDWSVCGLVDMKPRTEGQKTNQTITGRGS